MAQGTIRDFDEATRSGMLLTDERAEVAIDDRSIGDTAIRTLRVGQRVRFAIEEHDGAAIARDLRLVTFD